MIWAPNIAYKTLLLSEQSRRSNTIANERGCEINFTIYPGSKRQRLTSLHGKNFHCK